MKRWLIGLVVFVFAGCGSDDPQGPPQVQTAEAVVTVDWPLAREPGFVEARYSIKAFDFDTTTYAHGPIPQTGTTVAQFTAECGGVGVGPQLFVVTFGGHYSAHEEDPRAVEEEVTCSMVDTFSFPDCDNPLYTTEPSEEGAPRWQCEPPSGP